MDGSNNLDGSVGSARITYSIKGGTFTCITVLIAYSRDDLLTMIQGLFGRDACIVDIDEGVVDGICPSMKNYRVKVKQVLDVEQPNWQNWEKN